MKITFKTIELSTRREGDAVVVLNGMEAEVTGFVTTGTEKQVAWATQIMQKAMNDLAENWKNKNAPKGLINVADLEKGLTVLNQSFAVYADKINGKAASAWIDNKDLNAVAMIRAIAA